MLGVSINVSYNYTIMSFRSFLLFPGTGHTLLTPSSAALYPSVIVGNLKSKFDLTEFTQARIHIRCNYTGTGHDVGLEYSVDGGQWNSLTRMTLTGTGTFVNDWTALDWTSLNGEPADLYIRAVHGDGNQISPAIYEISLQVK